MHFRRLAGFHKSQLNRIVKSLKIPSNIAKFALTPLESFVIFIVRQRSGCTYNVLAGICGREITTISKVISIVTCYLFRLIKPALSATNAPWLSGRLAEFDQILVSTEKSISGSRIIGFIDGTHAEIARPYGGPNRSNRLQNSVFSGHKKTHIMKYQAVTTPDGLCIDLTGPFSGSQHDSFMFMHSDLYDRLKQALRVGGSQYRIYGDPAYRSSDILTLGYKGQRLTADQKKKLNKILSTSRVSIEWFFGAVKNNFQVFNAHGRLKVGGVRGCGAYFPIAVFLTNVKHCLEGSQASQYFDVDPPSFEEYMSRLKFPKMECSLMLKEMKIFIPSNMEL